MPGSIDPRVSQLNEPRAPAASGDGILRVVAGAVGIIAILIGLTGAFNLSKVILSVLSSPAEAQPVLRQWAEVLGGAQLDLPYKEGVAHLATPLAALLIGLGVSMAGWLLLGIMTAGARVVSYSIADKEAVKKILSHVYGPAMRPRA